MIDGEVVELDVALRVAGVARPEVEGSHAVGKQAGEVFALTLGTAGVAGHAARGSIVGTGCGEHREIGVAGDGGLP